MHSLGCVVSLPCTSNPVLNCWIKTEEASQEGMVLLKILPERLGWSHIYFLTIYITLLYLQDKNRLLGKLKFGLLEV